MYEAFFGLHKKAFDMTPDPAFLFMTTQHREALAGLTYGILVRKGFLVLSGKAGTGKTTLLAWLLAKLSSAQVKTSVILNPMLTPSEFLEMVMLDFGIEKIPQSKAQRLYILQKFLLETRQSGQTAALIIDESHKLNPELLEEIRLLGNYEQPDGKLLQILMAGQSELDDLLSSPELWQLKQRISLRLAIEPLDRVTTEHYIRHRWMKAGGSNDIPFAAGALDAIFDWSWGIPRLVNSLCDNALTQAFADSSNLVQAAHVETASKDLRLPRPDTLSVAKTPLDPAPAPRAQKTAIGEVEPIEPRMTPVMPVRITTLERYAAPGKVSLVARWAARFGLA